jgi:adenylosuccinate synthase
MLNNFYKKGHASIILGGQWGIEGTGAAAAFTAMTMTERNEVFDLVTVATDVRSVQTSVHHGKTRTLRHLPTYPLIVAADRALSGRPRPVTYLNGGSVIDPEMLLREIREHGLTSHDLVIHPNAAIITDECRALECSSLSRSADVALSQKLRRAGMIAKNCEPLTDYVQRIDLSRFLSRGSSVLIEVPGSYSASIDGPFYPFCGPRNNTVAAALADAGIHPTFAGPVMLAIRTYPVQDGAICNHIQIYPDQAELSWRELDLEIEPAVNGRLRRVFSFSHRQLIEALTELRPDVLHVSGCEHMEITGMDPAEIRLAVQTAAREACMLPPQIQWQYGQSTHNVFDSPKPGNSGVEYLRA